MERSALMALLHKRFRSVTSTSDPVAHVTRLAITNNGHVSIDATVEAFEKLEKSWRASPSAVPFVTVFACAGAHVVERLADAFGLL